MLNNPYYESFVISSTLTRRKAVKGFLIGISVILLLIFIPVGYALGWFGEAATVAREEFSPRAMLKKYEWFKDAAAQLEKKQADIAVYGGRMTAMNETYKNLSRQKWPREDREQYNV